MAPIASLDFSSARGQQGGALRRKLPVLSQAPETLPQRLHIFTRVLAQALGGRFFGKRGWSKPIPFFFVRTRDMGWGKREYDEAKWLYFETSPPDLQIPSRGFIDTYNRVTCPTMHYAFGSQ